MPGNPNQAAEPEAPSARAGRFTLPVTTRLRASEALTLVPLADGPRSVQAGRRRDGARVTGDGSWHEDPDIFNLARAEAVVTVVAQKFFRRLTAS